MTHTYNGPTGYVSGIGQLTTGQDVTPVEGQKAWRRLKDSGLLKRKAERKPIKQEGS